MTTQIARTSPSSPDRLVRLDPSHALCWESDSVLRVGFERPLARVEPASPGAQRLIRRLIDGVSESELAEISRGVDQQGAELRRLLGCLEPALVRTGPSRANSAVERVSRSAIRAVLSDDGREIPGLRAALEADWLCRFEHSAAVPELAVQILRFLEPLERTRGWLGDGVPHLLIRFTDDAALIGPLVSVRGSPCHTCEVLGLVDADPALPRLAAQLYGRVPGAESPPVARLVGAIAANYVSEWRASAEWVHDTQVRVPAVGGRIAGFPALHRIAPHPECGCTWDTSAPSTSR